VFFNMIYAHGVVSGDFGRGITIPVPKDRHDELSYMNTDL